jgi:hypothetical protein
MCDPFGGGVEQGRTSSTTKIPQWVEESGRELFEGGQTYAGRDYPAYPVADRIAPFTEDQMAGFEATRGNVGTWQPAYGSAYAGAGASAAPVGAEDISRYMNPFTGEVIDTTIDAINRQYNRDTNVRHGQMVGRGSYLNEDRREVIDNLARESRDRVIAETVARLKSDAFSGALGQANTERGRTLAASQMFGQLAPLRSALGGADAEALGTSGAVQQIQDQMGRNLTYDEFTGEFSYPQEQIDWLMSLLRGTPYETSTTGTTPVATGNPWAQAIGAGAGLYSIFG